MILELKLQSDINAVKLSQMVETAISSVDEKLQQIGKPRINFLQLDFDRKNNKIIINTKEFSPRDKKQSQLNIKEQKVDVALKKDEEYTVISTDISNWKENKKDFLVRSFWFWIIEVFMQNTMFFKIDSIKGHISFENNVIQLEIPRGFTNVKSYWDSLIGYDTETLFLNPFKIYEDKSNKVRK